MLTGQAPDTIYWNPLVIHLVLLLIPFFLFHRDIGKGWLFHLCLTHVLVDVPREEFLVSLIFSWYLQALKDAFVSPISVSVEWEALQPSTVSYLFVCFLNESEKVRGAEAFWFVLPAIT